MVGAKARTTFTIWWVAIIFLVLAVTFAVDLWGTKRAVIEHEPVARRYFDPAPVRTPLTEPEYTYQGKLYRCNDCHATLEPSTIQKSHFSSHPDVILQHGANNHCQTCHNRNNMDMLVDLNRNDVPFTQSQRSCLQCHGPIYRDWERGLHGRMNDYWDEERGAVRRLTCVACHDPHQPAFAPMNPAPAPHMRQYRDIRESISTKDVDHDG
ncbi:MAG: hypothetical protein KC897_00735 [Candidatus Omnitrophica bacterium]|nr:hypothetical protein [Candidatus Omnitrophota bacterium]MCB9719977.1 hypothetical protein [Candidatus Omnitrophota bacterium]